MKENNKSKVFWKIFVMITLIFVSASFFILKTDAAVTKYINYQGKLTDNTGTPVPDGAYNIIYRVYNHATNNYDNCIVGVNACLWEETKSVTTKSGLFTTSLADNTAFNDALMGNYDGATYYLAVKVVGDIEMTPRKRITGALYALNSDRLGGKQETEFADLDENETVSGLWTFSAASVDVQNDLYTDNVYLDVGGTDIDLEANATPTTSGAYAVGANDEFANSASTNVQDVLDDLDSAITAGASLWTDAGTYTYLTATADDLVIGSNATSDASLYFEASSNKLYVQDYINFDYDSTAIGLDTLANNTGIQNVAVGAWALDANIGGTYNVAVGNLALTSNITGNSNAAIGPQALRANTSGSYNSALGYQSQYLNSTGLYNVSLGARSLYNNTTSFNTAIGHEALYSDVSGSNNVAMGYQSLYSNQTGSQNVAIGNGSLYSTTNRSGLTAIGFNALYNNTGSANTAIGYWALNANTTGSYNTAIGSNALDANISGQHNVAIGPDVLGVNTTGSYNFAAHRFALRSNTTGVRNIAIGYTTLFNNIDGNDNIGLGYGSLYDSVGNGNIALGYVALENATGDYNVGIGYHALRSNVNGNRNVALGAQAGYSETGSNKLFIDNRARGSEAAGRIEALIYGEFDAAVSNQLLRINAKTQIQGNLLPYANATYDIGSSPDARWKDAYFSGTVYHGSTLAISDAGILDTNGNLVLQADNDTTNYFALSSDGTDLTINTTDASDLYIKPAGDQLIFQNGVDAISGIQFLDADGGTPILNIDTANEFVGIGTNTPGVKLDVVGGANFTLGATEKIYIDAATTTHTNAGQGALEIDFKSNTSSADAILVNLDTSGSAAGALIHGIRTGITTGAGDDTDVWAYEASIGVDNATTSDIIGYHASGVKSNSGSYTPYSVNAAHTGSGEFFGFRGILNHLGTGHLTGDHFTITQNGTGFVTGSKYMINTATSTNAYGDFKTITHSGNFFEIRGSVINVTHNTAAAAGGLMEGLAISMKNQAQVQDVHGIYVNLNHSSDPTGESHGLKISRTAGHVDSFIYLNGLADFGINMRNATFASYDILLSSNGYIKGGGVVNEIELGEKVIIPDSNSGIFELTVTHGSTLGSFGAIKADVTGTSGATYGIYAENDSNNAAAASGRFVATDAARAVWATAGTGWAGYFSSGDGVYMDKLSIGDLTPPAYNTIGTAAASHASLDSVNDLFIADNLEVDGHAWFDGGHTDIAEYIVITENGIDKSVQYILEDNYRKTDLAGAIVIADSNHAEKATLTGIPYDKRIIGVIATNPSLTISGGISEEYGYPIVLSGRIKTNVCNENGTIEIGDFITTSSKSGYGMKATEPGMVVGQALETFNGSPGQCGQVLVFQNIGWYHNAEGFVSNAVTFGLEKVEGGDFSQINTNIPQSGDLHLTGKLFGYNNNWSIDENGIFTVHETLADGSSLDLYALMSVNKEITISGQARLEDGKAEVIFENSFDQFIDENYKILVTPTSECNGLFVFEKTIAGFIVKELNNGDSNTTFDWLVIAQRTGFISQNQNTDPSIDNSNSIPSNNSSGSSSNIPDLSDSNDNADNTSDSNDTDSGSADNSLDIDLTDSGDSGSDTNDDTTDTSSDTADNSIADTFDSENSDAFTSDADMADSGSGASDSSSDDIGSATDSSSSGNSGDNGDSDPVQ